MPEVSYGRSKEFVDVLDVEGLTGKKMGIKFIDFSEYSKASGEKDAPKRTSASLIINPNKTTEVDPDNIYIAITPDINSSTLIHQIAHVIGFLKGSFPLPGEQVMLGEAQEMPPEHVDHPQEFGALLLSLQEQFSVDLDAEDWIIAYLGRNEMLIPNEDLTAGDAEMLLYRSAMILNYLREHGEEINEAIQAREGYIGKQDTGKQEKDAGSEQQ